MTTPGAHGPPPPPNPVLSAYEGFVRDTPLVTRYTITTLFTSWLLSWFVDPSYAVSNIPLFTVFKFELYRILFSPLVCTSILSLIFAYMSFTDNGKRLEHSIGSTAFAVLIATLGCVTNLAFLALCVVLYYATGNQSWLLSSSSGIWIVLLGLIAIECSGAPRDTKRRLFVFEVPVVYYPLAILLLFSLFGGPRLHYMLSVGVGYAYGYGYLDKFKISNSRFSRWEDGLLNNFTQRQGWVVGHAATGSAAWLPANNTQAEGQGWSPTTFFSQPASGDGSSASAPTGGWGASAPGDVKKPTDPAKSFPSGGGRALGGASRRPNSEARAAMLEAASRRSEAATSGEETS